MSIFGTYDVFLNGDIAGELTISRKRLLNVFAFRSSTVFQVSRLICLSGGKAVSIGIPVPEDGGMSLTRSLSDDSLRLMGLTSVDRCLIVGINAPLSDFSEAPESAAADIPAPENTMPPIREKLPDCHDEVAPEATEQPDPSVQAEEAAPSSHSEPEPTEVSSSEAATSAPRRIAVPGADGWYFEPEPWRLFRDASLSSLCMGLDGAMVRDNGASMLLALPYSPSAPFPLIPAFRSGSAATIGGKSFIVYRIEDGRPG